MVGREVKNIMKVSVDAFCFLQIIGEQIYNAANVMYDVFKSAGKSSGQLSLFLLLFPSRVSLVLKPLHPFQLIG